MRDSPASAAGSAGAAAAGRPRPVCRGRGGGAFGGGLLAGFLGSLEQVFWDLGHDVLPITTAR